MKFLLFIAAIISVIGCNQQKTESKEKKTEIANPTLDSVQSFINAALDYHTAASNNYDLKACWEMFTDDANVIEYITPVKRLIGKKEIDSSTALELEYFKQVKASFEVKWETHSLRINNDFAYQDATVNYTMNMPDSTPVKVSADTYLAWKKTGSNQWKVHTFVLYPR